MIDEATFRRLKKEVEEAKSEAERAQGALDQVMRQLKSEFKCSSLKQARELLVEMEVRRDKAERRFQAALKQYEEKWK